MPLVLHYQYRVEHSKENLMQSWERVKEHQDKDEMQLLWLSLTSDSFTTQFSSVAFAKYLIKSTMPSPLSVLLLCQYFKYLYFTLHQWMKVTNNVTTLLKRHGGKLKRHLKTFLMTNESNISQSNFLYGNGKILKLNGP